jgi:hypothetical protein
MSVVSTILRGVQDGPGVGVVGSAADADRQALSGDRSDLPGRSPHGASASVSGGDLADRDVLERLAQCFPSPATCWRVCSKRRGLWASVRWMARRRSTGPKPLQTGPLRRPNKGHKRRTQQLRQGLEDHGPDQRRCPSNSSHRLFLHRNNPRRRRSSLQH